MVVDIQQNLFDFDAAEAIFHCANCQNKMMRGFALEIRNRYPEAIQADLATVPGDFKKLGTFSYAQAKNGKHIYNLYGQFYYGTNKRHLNYDAIYTSMESAMQNCNIKKIQSIAIPYMMGCSLAGGNWKIVRTMIEVLSEGYNGNIYICQKI